MEKSRRYMQTTAIQITRVSYESESRSRNHEATSLVHPMMSKFMPTRIDPATMKGRRRPIVKTRQM